MAKNKQRKKTFTQWRAKEPKDKGFNGSSFDFSEPITFELFLIIRAAIAAGDLHSLTALTEREILSVIFANAFTHPSDAEFIN